MATNIEVSIPVTLGGYTGQRDAWEQSEHNWTVKYGVGIVTLESPGTTRRKITFALDDLNEALDFLKNQIARQASEAQREKLNNDLLTRSVGTGDHVST